MERDADARSVAERGENDNEEERERRFVLVGGGDAVYDKDPLSEWLRELLGRCEIVALVE